MRLINVIVPQQALQISIRRLAEFEKQVFDIYVIMRARQAQPGGCFERLPTGIVQFANQRLEAHAHAVSLSCVLVRFPGGLLRGAGGPLKSCLPHYGRTPWSLTR